MTNFLKEWRGVIFIALILFILIAVLSVFMKTTAPYIETNRAVCYKIAQKFNPPIQWRWNPWGNGNGCEILMNGTWFPADMVSPKLGN